MNYFTNPNKESIQFEDEIDDYKSEYPVSNIMNKELIKKFKEYIEFYSSHLDLKNIEQYNMDTANDKSLFKLGVYEEIDKIVITLKRQWEKLNDFKDKLCEHIGEKGVVKIEHTNTNGYYLSTTNKRKSELKDVVDEYELEFKIQKSNCKIFSPLILQVSEKICKYQEQLQELNKKKFIEFLKTIDNSYSDILLKSPAGIALTSFYLLNHQNDRSRCLSQ